MNDINDLTLDFSFFLHDIEKTQQPTFTDLRNKQQALEDLGISDALRELRTEYDAGPSAAHQQTLLRQTNDQFTAVIANHLGGSGPGRPPAIREMFPDIPHEVMAHLTLREMLGLVDRDNSLQVVCKAVGKALQVEQNLHDRKLADPDGLKSILQAIRKETGRPERRYAKLVKEFGNLEYDQIKAAHHLVMLAIEHLGLFTTSKKKSKGQGRSQNPDILKLSVEGQSKLFRLRRAQERMIRPDKLPMVCVPLAWSSPSNGGYQTVRKLAIKVQPITIWSVQYIHMLQDQTPQAFYDVLNHLQQTGWVIDTDVAKAMPTVLSRPSFIKVLVNPDDEDENDDEDQPDTDTDSDEAISNDLTSLRFRQWVPALKNTLAGVKPCLTRGQPFYYVWQADFRGRCYPVCEILGPQGHDSALGLLRFAEAKPLGRHGEKWLALHGANVLDPAELKFADLDKRIDWVHRHSDDIVAAAEDPSGYLEFLGGDAQSLKQFSKHFWQALSFCIEWRRLQREGANTFESALPVAVDGTCNAIQHLAALTRCEVIGAKVNLIDGPLKQDIYGRVAERLKELLNWAWSRPAFGRNEDSTGETNLHEFITAMGGIDHVITRSFCKIPVMAKPYGLTHGGMRNKIWDWFKDSPQAKEFHAYDLKLRNAAIKELQTALEQVMKDEITLGIQLMDWMKSCASKVASCNEPIEWRTYLNLPIRQISPKLSEPKEINTHIKSAIQSYQGFTKLRKNLSVKSYLNQMSPQSAANGIVANFVHAQDATHMMMVTLRAKAAGIGSLRMVHDSFATHAADMEVFSDIIRDTFVELYTQHDAVGSFAQSCESILTRYNKSMPDKGPPAPGKLDIEAVRTSRFFFS